MKRLILFSGIEHKNNGWIDQILRLSTIFEPTTLLIAHDNEFNKTVVTGDKYWLSPIVSGEDFYDKIQLVYIVSDGKIIPKIIKYFDEVVSQKIHGIFTRKFTDDVDIFEMLTRLNSGGLVKSKSIDMVQLETSATVRYIK